MRGITEMESYGIEPQNFSSLFLNEFPGNTPLCRFPSVFLKVMNRDTE